MAHPEAPFRGYEVSLERTAIADDPSHRGVVDLGQEYSLGVDLRVHPAENGVIIVNYPGYNGTIDGYENKYGQVGDFLQRHGAAVVRTNNPHNRGFWYPNSVQDHLRAVLDHTLDNTEEIAGVTRDRVRLFLMGFSAGAGAIAAVAHEYPEAERMLLMAPAMDPGTDVVIRGLSRFVGQCHIVVGENDEVVGTGPAKLLAQVACRASVVRDAVIPDCGHQFTGETNGRIMSAAPRWAFANVGGDSPSPNDGIRLYG